MAFSKTFIDFFFVESFVNVNIGAGNDFNFLRYSFLLNNSPMSKKIWEIIIVVFSELGSNDKISFFRKLTSPLYSGRSYFLILERLLMLSSLLKKFIWKTGRLLQVSWTSSAFLFHIKFCLAKSNRTFQSNTNIASFFICFLFLLKFFSFSCTIIIYCK